MKFGIRKPSLKRRISARTSWKRYARHSLKLKAPRGAGWITNPKKALYNRVYNRTSISVDRLIKNPSSKNIILSLGSFSTLSSITIFMVLGISFSPLAVIFLIYKIYKFSKKSVSSNNTISNGVVSSLVVSSREQKKETRIIDTLLIPEPTKSLLWITDEDTSKISSPFTIRLTIDNAKRNINVDDGHNFYSEPSLIWSKLPVKQNNNLEDKPMYYPSYSGLSAEHRYQYLKWLTNVTQETNLSYVFLYYYGLERHLLIGNFELAFDEIIRLLRHHKASSFRSYAVRAMIAASAFRKKPEVLNKAQFILEEVSNPALVLRKMAGVSLKAADLLNLANSVSFYNKRYIKAYPKRFKNELQKIIDQYHHKHGDILQSFNLKNLPKESSNYFANASLPDNIGSIPTPQIKENDDFKITIKSLLQQAHDEVKLLKKLNKLKN